MNFYLSIEFTNKSPIKKSLKTNKSNKYKNLNIF